MKTYGRSKDRLHAWLTAATFDPEKGCRHPRDLIAAALEINERTITRCTQQLVREGRLRVVASKRRGECNTYFVTDWTPGLRAPVLNRIRQVKPGVLARRVQRRQNAECPPKRTAGLRRDETTLRSGSQVVDQRCWSSARVTEDSVPQPIDVVRERLDAGGWEPKGPNDKFRALCPAHNDRHNPALIVSERSDRSVGVFCLASCETTAVVAALGLQMRDLFPPRQPGAPRPKPRRHRSQRSLSRRQLDRKLAQDGYPVDRVLARLLGDYRGTPTPGFWVASCRVCGELDALWIWAPLDDGAKPSGPVTVSCKNGCYR